MKMWLSRDFNPSIRRLTWMSRLRWQRRPYPQLVGRKVTEDGEPGEEVNITFIPGDVTPEKVTVPPEEPPRTPAIERRDMAVNPESAKLILDLGCGVGVLRERLGSSSIER
jgi:2-polyprenyl-3-methyl-5-hydroxy-6-metoxy-1,4-benzoquinol methylase